MIQHVRYMGKMRATGLKARKRRLGRIKTGPWILTKVLSRLPLR